MVDRLGTVTLRSGLVVSRLGLGTARLHYCSSATRRKLVEHALELGFTHFDTAPCYGDTLAEHELGRALKPHRSRVVLATKYGIPPNPIIAAAPSLALPLRTARTMARKLGLGSG